MSEAPWGKQGATLSHKNACKEFGITEEEIFEAIRKGNLQCRQNYAHGNPYFKLLRVEVERYALELRGNTAVEEQAIEHQLRGIDKEINSIRRRLASLEKQKMKLLEIQRQRKS